MKHLALLILLTVVCTVNYPSDCTIVNTDFKTGDENYKAQVECSYQDGSRTVYYAEVKKGKGMKRPAKVDYLPSVSLSDSATVSCQ